MPFYSSPSRQSDAKSRQFALSFDNGYRVSVVWHRDAYISDPDNDGASLDAEVLVKNHAGAQCTRAIWRAAFGTEYLAAGEAAPRVSAEQVARLLAHVANLAVAED